MLARNQCVFPYSKMHNAFFYITREEVSTSILFSFFSHLSYLSRNMKRAKDNSGTGYSYGTAINTLSSTPARYSPTNYSKSTRCTCRDQVIVAPKDEMYKMQILRTTAINSDTVDDIPVIEVVSLLSFFLCFFILSFHLSCLESF